MKVNSMVNLSVQTALQATQLVQVQAIPGALILELAYGTPQNFTGQVIYTHPHCFIHQVAFEKLMRAVELARAADLQIKLFDAFRPQEAQEKLWAICPDPRYVADPAKGSLHSRGIAVDLTLADAQGIELDMGTPFDDFTDQSHQGCTTISVGAQRNRFLLKGLMQSAGFTPIQYEWWHFNGEDPSKFPLLKDQDAPLPMMG